MQELRGSPEWIKVVRAYNLCDRLLSAQLAELGIPLPEHEVLINLLRAPGATQQEIAARCFIAKSGVSMLLLQMEKRQLIKREQDLNDSRIKRSFLTSKGKALANKAFKIQSQLVATMSEVLSDSDLSRIASVMDKLSLQLDTAYQEFTTQAKRKASATASNL